MGHRTSDALAQQDTLTGYRPTFHLQAAGWEQNSDTAQQGHS